MSVVVTRACLGARLTNRADVVVTASPPDELTVLTRPGGGRVIVLVTTRITPEIASTGHTAIPRCITLLSG